MAVEGQPGSPTGTAAATPKQQAAHKQHAATAQATHRRRSRAPGCSARGRGPARWRQTRRCAGRPVALSGSEAARRDAHGVSSLGRPVQRAQRWIAGWEPAGRPAGPAGQAEQAGRAASAAAHVRRVRGPEAGVALGLRAEQRGTVAGPALVAWRGEPRKAQERGTVRGAGGSVGLPPAPPAPRSPCV